MSRRNTALITLLIGGAVLYARRSEKRAEAARREKELEASERRRLEAALKRAGAKTAELFSAVSSLMIAVDVEGRVTHWNHSVANTLGLTEQDVLGRSLAECGVRWELPERLRRCGAFPLPETLLRLEDIKFTRADGKEGLLGLTLHPLFGEDGAKSGVLILGADVSERRSQETRLRQSQKLESIGQLAAGVAHEINTPMQYVGDNIRFLADAFGDLKKVLEQCERLSDVGRAGEIGPELIEQLGEAIRVADIEYLLKEIPKAIQQSLDGIERITVIVRSMKNFAHPDTGEMKAVDLNNAIESTITVSRNEWKYLADLVTDFDADLPLVPCLLGEFNQVILNMIVNASHAISDVTEGGVRGKGRITVSTRRDGDWVEISISDTGTGIPEKLVSRIFDPFFTTKEVGKGTGQGLAISHNVVVEKHGGHIACETKEGRGTTFRIRLPLFDKSPRQSRKEAA